MRLFISSLVLFFTSLTSFAQEEEENKWVDPSSEQIEFLKQGFIADSSLKDPFSVQFRNTKVDTGLLNGGMMFCGEMNAKNSYGAYTGWKVFSAVYSSRLAAKKEEPWGVFLDDDDPEGSVADILCEDVFY